MNLEDIIAALSANTQRAPIPQRQQTPPVIGPGGITSPSFIPNEVMQNFRPAPPQQANPELFRGPMHASPLRIDQTRGSMSAPIAPDAYAMAPQGKFAPPALTEELTPEYLRTRGDVSFTGRYLGGDRERRESWAPVPQPPQSAYRDIPDRVDEDSAAWNAARERVQAQMAIERQNTNMRIPRPGAPLIGQAYAATAQKNTAPERAPPRFYRNLVSRDGEGRWRRGGS